MEDLSRDVVIATTVAQKLRAGDVVTKCADCGAACCLDYRGVKEIGQRPAAVVQCDVCASKARSALDPNIIDEMIGASQKEAGAPVGDALLKMIEEFAQKVAPNEITTYFEFDPPEAAEACQAAMKERDDRYSWRWTNDTGTPVMLTARQRRPDEVERQMVIMHGDELALDVPKASALHIPSFPIRKGKPRRPIRDNPQA